MQSKAATGEEAPRTKIGERLATLEARKKEFFRGLSRRLAQRICQRHEESLRLLGDHKE